MKTGEIIMEYNTEGFIKEITVKGNAPIMFTLAPTDEFAFGKDESDGRKIILLKRQIIKTRRNPWMQRLLPRVSSSVSITVERLTEK